MQRPAIRKLAALAGVFALVWLSLRFLLPLAMPFLMGAGLALAAEPLVGFFITRLHLKRGAATGIGVTVALILLSGLVLLVLSLLVRELGVLAGVLPNVEQTARQGLSLLEDFLRGLANRAPAALRPLLNRSVSSLSGSGAVLLDQASGYVAGFATWLLAQIPDGALTIGTAILSAFMISARLPRMKAWLGGRLSGSARQRFLPALKKIRHALGGWLKAQVKLAGMSFLIVTAGLLLLGVPYAPVWAFLTALVDAVPMLGTGTVLLPWALVRLLQRDPLQAAGLTAVYAVASLTRSALEPRLVGKHLGLDPLVTLIALYIGYQFWGLWGMILAPMLAVTASELSDLAR